MVTFIRVTRNILLLFFLAPLFIAAPAYADCADPAGVEGDQTYNLTYKTMMFCDGTNWYTMKGSGGADTLAGLSCNNNEIAKWNGSAWACAADDAGSGSTAWGDLTGVPAGFADGMDDGITAESDPQVGTLTNTKWCATDGTTIDCTQDAPSGGGGFPTTVDFQIFTSSGTWTKPGSGTTAFVQCWGAGGGGGRHDTACGGGGGAYAQGWFALSSLGATVTVTIGAGGAGQTTNAAGGNGGNSTFGPHLTAAGGTGGGFNSTTCTATAGGAGAIAAFNGGNGGESNTANGGYKGDDAIYGGAGGGATDYNGSANLTADGGRSVFGGDGGDAGDSDTGDHGYGARRNGHQPGGGGAGGNNGTSGAGGDGMCQVTVY
jgi:hypothetical protein